MLLSGIRNMTYTSHSVVFSLCIRELLKTVTICNIVCSLHDNLPRSLLSIIHNKYICSHGFNFRCFII